MRKIVKARKPLVTVSQESVAFQSLNFFAALVEAFIEVKALPAAELERFEDFIPDAEGKEKATPMFSADNAIMKLSTIITQYTGLKVSFVFSDSEPMVRIPSIDKNNVLINSFMRGHATSADGLQMIASSPDLCRGTVNIQTGKVSGVFSELPCHISLPIYAVKSSTFTPAELAAITLHEIGHLFTYFEYMSRTVTTNQCLAGMSKALDGSDSVAKREVVLLSVSKAMRLGDLDVKELAKNTDAKVIEIVVVSNLVKESISELGCDVFDFNSAEYLADQYVARQGAGRDLVTASDKLYKNGKHQSYRGNLTYLLMEGLKCALFVGGLSTFGLMSTVFGLWMIASDSTAFQLTQVQPGSRFRRIRNEIVQNLKDRSLSADDTKRLEEDLVVIDQCLDRVNDRRQLAGIVCDFVIPNFRKTRSAELLQRQLEDLANNDLFVKAAQLKRMATD